MAALADYVHQKGLKFGVYTARGSRTCQNRPGAYQHEEIDAATYCDWGLDYLKGLLHTSVAECNTRALPRPSFCASLLLPDHCSCAPRRQLRRL